MKYCKMTALGLSLCLLFAGCGGSKSREPSTDPSPTGTTDEPLTLKLLAPLEVLDLGNQVQVVVEATGYAKTNALRWTVEGNLPTGLELRSEGRRATISGTVRELKTFTATIRADDGFGQSAQLQVTTTVRNNPISFATLMLPAARQGEPYATQVEATGGGDDHYGWQILSRVPLGLSIHPEKGQLKLDGTLQTPGVYTLSLEVWNEFGQRAQKSFDLAVNSVLAVKAEPLALAEMHKDIRLNLHVEGGTGKDYTWSVIAGRLPQGLALKAEGRDLAVQGQPTEAGDFQWTLQVTDRFHGLATYPMKLSISPGLAFKTVTLAKGTVADAYQSTIELIGGWKADYELVGVDGLPSGLTARLDKEQGAIIIEGLPRAQTFQSFVTVRVRVRAGQAIARTFALTIDPKPPTFVTETLEAIAADKAASIRIQARSATGNRMNWTVNTNTLPNGLTFTKAGDAAILSGSAMLPGVYLFTVKFEDDQGKIARDFELHVRPEKEIFELLARSLPRVGVQQNYEQTLQVQNGLIKSFKADQLPAGLHLEKVRDDERSLRLFGKPTQAGFYRLQIQVESTEGEVANTGYALAVVQPSAWLYGTLAASSETVLIRKDDPTQRIEVGRANYPALSPDNQWLVYQQPRANAQPPLLYLGSLAGEWSAKLLGEGDASINWSPDSQRFAVRLGKSLRIYDIRQKAFVDSEDLPTGMTAANWSEDGTKLVYCESYGSNQLNMVTFIGNKPRLSRIDTQGSGCDQPKLVPGGRFILNRNGLQLLRLSGGVVDFREGWVAKTDDSNPGRLIVSQKDGTTRFYDLGAAALAEPRSLTLERPLYSEIWDQLFLTQDGHTLMICRCQDKMDIAAINLRQGTLQEVALGLAQGGHHLIGPRLAKGRQEFIAVEDADGLYAVNLKTMRRWKLADKPTEYRFLANGQALVLDERALQAGIWSLRSLEDPEKKAQDVFATTTFLTLSADPFENMITYLDPSLLPRVRRFAQGTFEDLGIKTVDILSLL